MRCPLAPEEQRRAQATLIAALLGFFVITLDAVVVNVALPTLAHDLSAGVDGLQWVVDGYTLMFGALLLSAGALVDRIGARRAFGMGLAVFVAASLACGWAPTLAMLIAARLAQGIGAAASRTLRSADQVRGPFPRTAGKWAPRSCRIQSPPTGTAGYR